MATLGLQIILESVRQFIAKVFHLQIILYPSNWASTCGCSVAECLGALAKFVLTLIIFHPCGTVWP